MNNNANYTTENERRSRYYYEEVMVCKDFVDGMLLFGVAGVTYAHINWFYQVYYYSWTYYCINGALFNRVVSD